MKGLGSFLITMYSLAFMAVSGVVAALSTPLAFLNEFRTGFLEIYNNWAVALAALVVFLLAFWVFIQNLRPAEKIQTINHQGELGEYRISFEALHNLVLQATRDIKGVRDTRPRLALKETGLVIDLKLSTLPDLKVPDLVEEVQNKVKTYVQEISGVDVAEVKVLVVDITKESRRK